VTVVHAAGATLLSLSLTHFPNMHLSLAQLVLLPPSLVPPPLVLWSLAGIVGVWAAYPLVMALLAALLAVPRRRAALGLPANGSQLPLVSVVLATRDDDASIERRVRDCLAATYAPARLEVVVALDATRSAPEVCGVAFGDARVRVVPGDAPGGKAAALNAGVRASRGDVLVFTDTHQRFQPDAIALLVAALADRRVGAVSGCLDLAEGRSRRSVVGLYWLMERWLRRSEARVHSSVGATGAIYALRRSLWKPVPTGLILDDVYTPMRVVLDGYRVGFVEAARALETRQTEAGQEYRRKVRTLTGVIQLCAWLPLVLVPIRNAVWLQFVCHKLLRFLTPYWVLVVALWMASVVARLMIAHPLAAIAAAGAAAAVSLLAHVNVARIVREALVSGVMLQAAVVVSTVNGFRGRWDVWRR
jgi:cellulose synthase/poly-beta-1,6-N-acetylglucosamine synthase-like glycosyltransferase